MTRRLQSLLSALTVAALLAGALALAACGPRIPSAPPGITGIVAEEIATGPEQRAILVKATTKSANQVADQARVGITSKTAFFDASGKRIDAPESLSGATVSVWFDGAVAESYPVQGTAAAIRIE